MLRLAIMSSLWGTVASLAPSPIRTLRNTPPVKRDLSIAVCITGALEQNEAIIQTATNLKEVLLEPVASIASRLDVFVSVAEEQIDDGIWRAMEQWHPVRMMLYLSEPSEIVNEISKLGRQPPAGVAENGEVQAWAMDQEESLLLHRYQWNTCWERIEEEEGAVGISYDFVVRTRPDLLLDPAAVHPEAWSLWAYPEALSARGLCRCDDPHFSPDKGAQGAPVDEALVAAPRQVAARLMTMWDRLVTDGNYSWQYALDHVAKRCDHYRTQRDYFDCVTDADLAYAGYSLGGIKELSPPAEVSRKITIDECSVFFGGGGWTLFHSLPDEEQLCLGISHPIAH